MKLQEIPHDKYALFENFMYYVFRKSMAIFRKSTIAMAKRLGKKLRSMVKYDFCEAHLKLTHRGQVINSGPHRGKAHKSPGKYRNSDFSTQYDRTTHCPPYMAVSDIETKFQ